MQCWIGTPRIKLSWHSILCQCSTIWKRQTWIDFISWRKGSKLCYCTVLKKPFKFNFNSFLEAKRAFYIAVRYRALWCIVEITYTLLFVYFIFDNFCNSSNKVSSFNVNANILRNHLQRYSWIILLHFLHKRHNMISTVRNV